MDAQKWLDVFNARKNLDDKVKNKKTSGTITHNKGPIVLMLTSDWHIGSPYTDYQALLASIDRIKQYDPEIVRIGLVGDLIDNFGTSFKSAEAVLGQYIPPELQHEMLTEILAEISPYVDFATWGNHDIEWDEKNNGYSKLAKQLSKQFLYFHGKGTVHYKICNVDYNLLVSHHLKGNSIYHDLHGPIRAWTNTHADIIVAGHHHSPAYMTDYRGVDSDGSPLQRTLIKLGTHKTGNDTYSDRYFKSGIIGENTLILFPDRKKVLHFLDFEDAVKYLGISVVKTAKSVKQSKKDVKTEKLSKSVKNEVKIDNTAKPKRKYTKKQK